MEILRLRHSCPQRLRSSWSTMSSSIVSPSRSLEIRVCVDERFRVSKRAKLIALRLVVVMNLLGGGLGMIASMNNYPGGEAMMALSKYHSSSPFIPSSFSRTVLTRNDRHSNDSYRRSRSNDRRLAVQSSLFLPCTMVPLPSSTASLVVQSLGDSDRLHDVRLADNEFSDDSYQTF